MILKVHNNNGNIVLFLLLFSNSPLVFPLDFLCQEDHIMGMFISFMSITEAPEIFVISTLHKMKPQYNLVQSSYEKLTTEMIDR